MRRQRLGMPLSRRGDALVTCSREPAMRTPPTRLVTATKAASTGDTKTDRSTSTYFVSRARLSRYTAVIGRFSWSLRHQGLCIVFPRGSKVKSAMCNATPARVTGITACFSRGPTLDKSRVTAPGGRLWGLRLAVSCLRRCPRCT